MAITFGSEQAKDLQESSRTKLQLNCDRLLIIPATYVCNINYISNVHFISLMQIRMYIHTSICMNLKEQDMSMCGASVILSFL